MDSGSDKVSDYGRAKQLLNAIQGLLACGISDGLQATGDIYISDRAGFELARCRISIGWDDAGQVVVSQITPESGPSPATGKAEMGDW